MAQLVVRNVPEEVKERLKRRAELHGRSLEAEVRDILANTPASPARSSRKSKEGLGTLLLKKQSKSRLTAADWKSFDDAITSLRKNWRTRDIGLDE